MRSNSTIRLDARAGAALLLALLGAIGCAAHRPDVPPEPHSWSEDGFARKEIPAHEVAIDARGVPADTVVGATTTYRIREGDTLLDVARWYDLGYNEIVAANPGVDPWVPKPGTDVVLPTEWVLPCCTYDGIVVNLPEMRLYTYKRSKDDPNKVTVRTYPVGLGRDDRRTPRGTYRVRGKTENPQWNIPPSIRREHIAERGDHRAFIAGGAPDNPLGKHRIELSNSLYSIHGTDIPWGVGMLVSHGCLRLYPEDVARLFPEVAVGTKVQFVYQTVKVGTRDGTTYAEAHPDVYRYSRSLAADARSALKQRRLEKSVDGAVLSRVVGEATGVPVPVTAQPTSSPTTRSRRTSDGGDSEAAPGLIARSV